MLAVGGVATTDGGAGMLQALGARLTRANGSPVAPGGGGLAEADLTAAAHPPGRHRPGHRHRRGQPHARPERSPGRLWPQKGASAADVELLDRSLTRLARHLDARAAADPPEPGAAAGLGFAGLLLGGRLHSGADYFLTLLGADHLLSRSTLVITGEGKPRLADPRWQTPGRVRPPCPSPRGPSPRCRRPLHPDRAAVRRLLPLVQTLTALTEQDPATDPELTTRLLIYCGQTIAKKWI